MNIITSTELRTKMPFLLDLLSRGQTVDIIHRSKVIGEIKPKKYQGKPFTRESLKRLATITKKLNFPKLTDKQIEQRYRKHMMEKYGAGLS